VISDAAFSLRALGRLRDPVEPMRASAEAYVESKYWTHAAAVYGNFSDLSVDLGDIPEAVPVARQSAAFADRSDEAFQRVTKRITLAYGLHQSGDLSARPTGSLRMRKRIAEEQYPEYPILDGIAGYFYCDLLLDLGQTVEVLRRASGSLRRTMGKGSLLSIGVDHLSLGRAYPVGSVEAAHHLDQAVDFLRRAGQLDDLPRAVLARGTRRDLEEVFRIATRSGMRLYLADYHLAKATSPRPKR
jgi:hypothetical protein